MKKNTKCKINSFKYPTADKISGRTSTICRSMACTLLKRKGCSHGEEVIWKSFFPKKTCAYCGKEATHLDHLFALIDSRRPTGYYTEPANLVPCCRECNQPKGNLNFEEFMRSDHCHHIGDETTNDVKIAMENRIKTIKLFQEKMPASKVALDKETLEQWDIILKQFDEMLRKAKDDLTSLNLKLFKD